MAEYLITAGPLALVLWGFLSGRIVPRYVRRDLPERPLGFIGRLVFQLRRRDMAEDLDDLRRELEA